MADTIAELVPELREALSVDATYDAEVLPSIISKAIGKLLRDYHFPKALRSEAFTTSLSQQAYDLPAGFKKEHMVRFYDPVEDVYTQPLLKVPFRVPEPADGQSCHYWLEGAQLFTDVKIKAESVGIKLELYFESMDVADNEAWIVPDFEDVLFALCMLRASSQLRKTELAKVWRETWAEERTSLAVFANELHYDNSELMMRATSSFPQIQRYDTNG